MTIPEIRARLQQDVVEYLSVVQAGFDTYQRSAFIARPSEFFALELCGEAGELANIEKKRWRGSTIDRDHRAEEAADVLISLMNFCNAAEIDLASAVAQKLDRIKPPAEHGS